MEEWVTLAAALLGGTGIAGLVTGGVQWSQGARVRVAVERLAAVRKSLPKNSVVHARIDRAIEVEAVRLAAQSTAARRMPWLWYAVSALLLLIGTAVLLFAVFAERYTEQELAKAMSLTVPIAIGYFSVLAGAVSMLAWVRQRQFYRRVQRMLIRLDLLDDAP